MMVLILSTSLITTVSFADDISEETTTQITENIRDVQPAGDDAEVDVPVVTGDEEEAMDSQEVSENQNSESGVKSEDMTESTVELNINFEDFITGLLEALEMRENAVGNFQSASDKSEAMERARQIAQAEFDLLVQYYIPDDTTRPVEGNVAINRWMLQKCYMEGLKIQSTAPINDAYSFVGAWEKGYQYRLNALREMSMDAKLYESGIIPDFSKVAIWDTESDTYEENSYLAYIVQALLGINVDGEFGNGSRISLKDYQLAHDLVPNAVLDEAVLSSLMETMDITELDSARSTLEGLSTNNQLGVTVNVIGDILDSFDTYRSSLAL